jgi:S-methylmethionine-dependent homocysteine/selenocysteine methylase
MVIRSVAGHDARVRTYTEMIDSGDVLLTDGANGTRLRLETVLVLDPVLDVAGLASDGRAHALRAVSGEYVAIAAAVGLPIQLDAVSYWINPDRLASVGRLDELGALNRRCVQASAANRETFVEAEIFVAGVLGPRADGYSPTEIPEAEEAAAYHEAQAAALAGGGVDVLYGETLSTASEAVGMARAMALTGCPYAIGPVLDQHGQLPDGTPLETVIDTIDRAVTPQPVHYFINCTHPTVALAGLDAASDRGGDISRVIGIKANGSAEAPTDLDSAQSVHSDPPNDWAGSMIELRDRFGLRVLGGCCGTDGRHILALALRLTTSGPD